MNLLITAAAGSGKTTQIVNEALSDEKTILITTYTQACEAEIKAKIIEKNKSIPPNITVQTWFSFLLQHAVRPFQGPLYEKPIKNLILVNGRSGKKGEYRGRPIYFSEEKDFEKYYFNSDSKIYSDKIAKFALRCNDESENAVITRLSKIYDKIFIDEVQDLAGHDLEFLRKLFESPIDIILVGDPRQGTYSTNTNAKNSQFRKSDIVYFFDDKNIDIEKDDDKLTTNYRCNSSICDLSNQLYPNLKPTNSGNSQMTGHDGIFFVKDTDVNSYIEKYRPIQMRDSKRTKLNNSFPVINFGISKGLTFDRVLIYPTGPIKEWILDRNKELKPTSKSKLYVALTRAKYSVAIVYNYNDDKDYPDIGKYKNDT